MKQAIIAQIQNLVQNKDPMAGREIIEKMIQPILEQMNKEYLLEEMVQEILITMSPIQHKVAAEGYSKFFTEPQLQAYLEFLKANPWFTQANAEFGLWVITQSTERTQRLYQEMFEKYLGDNDEDEDENEEDDF